MSELVTISIGNHIADVRFNRPDKYSSVCIPEVMDAIRHCRSIVKFQ